MPQIRKGQTPLCARADTWVRPYSSRSNAKLEYFNTLAIAFRVTASMDAGRAGYCRSGNTRPELSGEVENRAARI